MRIWLFVTLAIFTAIPFSLRPAGAYQPVDEVERR